MQHPTKQRQIIIGTMILYLVIFTSGERIPLPMMVNVIMRITSLIMGGDGIAAFLYGILPLVAIMLLIIATSERVWVKDVLYMLAVIMLFPSVWFTLHQSIQVNQGFGLIALSEFPFCFISMFGFVYFAAKWIKRQKHG
ncbi:MAG TPA: hypothetical protein VNY36_06030 [Bacteroidia bacterium]|jgi:hypothetical protein|nr:hypothetical protein [Bacteroidia bacterium]